MKVFTAQVAGPDPYAYDEFPTEHVVFAARDHDEAFATALAIAHAEFGRYGDVMDVAQPRASAGNFHVHAAAAWPTAGAWMAAVARGECPRLPQGHAWEGVTHGEQLVDEQCMACGYSRREQRFTTKF